MPATTHAYGDHPDQHAELTLPDGAAPRDGFPVVVLVHGGFWLAEYGLERMRAIAVDLAARGWAAWNVEYRRLGRGSGGGWPQTAQDVSAAVDHLRGLAAPLDLARVVSVGHSAGGHLALLDAARTEAAVRVRAVVASAPLTDVRRAHALGGEAAAVVEAFLGGGPEARAAEIAAASPVTRVPLGVPLHVAQGDRDELVPHDMVIDFVTAARAAGDDVSFDLRAGASHFDIVEPGTAAWADTVARLEELRG